MKNDENENIKIFNNIIEESKILSNNLSNITSLNSELSRIQDNIEYKITQLSRVINPIEPLKKNDMAILETLDNNKSINSIIHYKTNQIIVNKEIIGILKTTNYLNLSTISVNVAQITNILNILLENYNKKSSELDDKLKEKKLNNNLIFTIEYENFNHENISIKKQLLEFTKGLNDQLKFILYFIEDFTNRNVTNFNENYFNRLKSDSDLIIKKLENKIENLIAEFDNRYKEIQLDQEKAKNSSNLLIQGVDSALKNLNDLNDRTQKIELEYSTIIGNESEKIKLDLNISKIKLLKIVDSIEQEANTKLININDAHTNFINLVQNAGIYELTQNYKTKADEEKGDYKLNMWLTVTAIVLAIIATIAVIAIPIIEHWKANPAVDMDYFTLFARFTISIMFFVLALYTSKQAAKHYECYQENHRTFLQLAALEPFMSSMSPDEQKDIRKGLISTYFSQNVDGKFASKGDEVDISANLFSLLSQTLTIVADKKEVKPQDDKA